MLLYSKYKDNKKHGITCLLKSGAPWLIQEWNKGALQSETVFVRKGSDFVAVDDTARLAQAKKGLSTVEKELAETESDLKKNLRKWFADEGDRIKKEKGKILTKVAKAQHKANEQAIRKQYAERARANADAVARSHPYSRVSGAARAARDANERQSRAADGNIKEANKNANAVTNEAKCALGEMDEEITNHYRQLYDFALTALEKSLLDEHVAPPASSSPAPKAVQPSPGKAQTVDTSEKDNRSRWVSETYADTAFIHVRGKQWTQIDTKKQKTVYSDITEISRSPKFIELFFPTRNEKYRLSAKRMELKGNSGWSWSHNGHWEK